MEIKLPVLPWNLIYVRTNDRKFKQCCEDHRTLHRVVAAVATTPARLKDPLGFPVRWALAGVVLFASVPSPTLSSWGPTGSWQS